MKLICIDDETDILNFGDGVKELTWGKEYEIKNSFLMCSMSRGDVRQYISLINDKGKSNDYLYDRFVTLETFREIKLNKILYDTNRSNQ